MPRLPKKDTQLLEAALIGFEHQREELEQKIADLRARIGGQAGTHSAGANHSKRTMSAAARKRIALAQKKRWAAYKAGSPKAAATKRKKRTISAEGRARIVAATKKRWAAYRKAQAAGQAG